jgi:hypothetical protein
MATTTNYSWTTPDDTALVKDGAAAIRTLGSSVDTTVKNLNPETTLGDISYRSSTANVKTRLALGTAGQILAVNSGATAPEWITSSSGGMDLLSTTTLSGSSTVISGISGSYKNLLVIVSGAVWGTAGAILNFRFNGSSSIAYGNLYGNAAASYGESFFTDGQITSGPQTVLNTGGLNAHSILVNNYANTSYYKPFSIQNVVQGVSNNFGGHGGGGLKTTSAITSLTVTNHLGYTFSAGEVLIYGVK